MTGYAEKAAEEAPDIEAIIKGFNVALPKRRRSTAANASTPAECVTKLVDSRRPH